MTTKLDKEAFIKLAEAYSSQEKYKDELMDRLRYVAQKNNMNLTRLPISSILIMDVVLDLLGYNFKYYFYNCSEDFNKFNKTTTLPDGTHPNVKNFGELWEFIHKLETEE